MNSDELIAPDPAPEAGNVAVPRFCRSCGAPLQMDGGPCPCAARRAAAQVFAGELRIEKRSLKGAICLYGALLAVSIINICVLLASGGKGSFEDDVAVTSVFFVIVVGFCIVNFRVILPAYARTGQWFWSAAAPAMAGCTYTLAAAAIALLHLFAGVQKLEYLPEFRAAGHGVPMALFMVAVMPAITEEAAFRGVIFGLLRRVLSPVETIFVTAGMFAILHLSPASLPHLFIMGVALAFLREKSGSIYPGMILHFSHNALCILVEHSAKGGPWF